jgi:hypothetical protein
VVTPQSARMLELMHPLRTSYERWNDRNPLARLVAREADKVRAQRMPVAANNPLLAMQEAFSSAITAGLNSWRDLRDAATEQTFDLVYGNPLVQALAGQGAGTVPRPHPGVTQEHIEDGASLDDEVYQGGLVEAGVRALFYVHRLRTAADERRFNLTLKLLQPLFEQGLHMDDFRIIVRRQARLMQHDFEAAMAALPVLLSRAHPEAVREMAAGLEQVVLMLDAPTLDEKASLAQVLDVFGQVTQAATKTKNAASEKTATHSATTA